jgi:hypothetical protein
MKAGAVLLAGLLALAGCGASHSSTSTGAASVRHGGCPISRLGGPPPPQRALMNFDRPIASASDPGWYGNGVLWTQFPTGGYDFIRGRGANLTLKMPWFRASKGPVTIDGRPLSGPSARFSASISAGDYGPYGFVPAGLVFGRPGCWLLRGHLAGHVLSVVLSVHLTANRARHQTEASAGSSASTASSASSTRSAASIRAL